MFRIFLALAIVFFRDIFSPFITKFSSIVSYIPLKLLFNASLNNNIITIMGKNIEYVPACAAVGAYIFLTLLILFTGNIPFKKCLKLFFIGSFLILVANIIRINVLAYILGTNNVDLFITLHLFTWKILSGIYVALVWIYLVKKYDIRRIPLKDDFLDIIKN